MAFTEKTGLSAINIKLTTKGRELLSRGRLRFKKLALGDSEIDYNVVKQKKDYITKINTLSENVINNLESFGKLLKPKDLNPNIISFVKKNDVSFNFIDIPTMPSYKSTVINQRESIGYFIFDEDNNVFLKEDLVLDSGQITNVSGENIVIPGTSFGVGSIILVKKNSDYSIVNPSEVLIFKIEASMGGTYVLDREFKLSGSGWYGFNLDEYRGEEVFGYYPSDYVFRSDGETMFFDNIVCEIVRFPYWKLSILFTKNILGVNGYPDNEDGEDKSYLEYYSSPMSGFVRYVQNHRNVFDMLGVIHFTNPSPTNVYAEGLHRDSTKITIPTIMWHRPNNTVIPHSEIKMGVNLTSVGEEKIIYGEDKSLKLGYYDLADEDGFIVGKVFNGLKVATIEDQELLFSLSFKSNRNWTLPKPNITKGGVV